MIDQIENGEGGGSVRAKINALISASNAASAEAGRRVVTTFAELATVPGYTTAGGRRLTAAGDIWTVLEMGRNFRVLSEASSVWDYDYTASGGCKFQLTDIVTLEATVGSAGMFGTINDALKWLSNQSRAYARGGVSAQVRLLSDFVMAEQVIVDRGIDLSWITIVADAAPVTISRAAITITTATLGDGFNSIGTYRAAFMAGGAARLPRLGCRMVMDTSGTAQDQQGIFLTHGAFAEIGAGCGIDNTTANGCYLNFGSTLIAPNSLWNDNGLTTSGNAKAAIRADWNCMVSAQGATVNNPKVTGLIILGGSTSSIREAVINNAALDGVEAGGVSLVHARGVQVNGAGRYGFFAGEGSSWRLLSTTISNALTGIYAEAGSRVNSASGTVISNSGNYAVRARDGAQVVLVAPNISGGSAVDTIRAEGGEVQIIGGTVSGTGANDLFVSDGGRIRLLGTVTTRAGNTLANNLANSNVAAFNARTNTDSIIYGRGGRAQSRGLATIASGGTSITVTHNIDAAWPLTSGEITVSPANPNAAGLNWYIANVTTTTFDIISTTAAPGAAQFNWLARKILL